MRRLFIMLPVLILFVGCGQSQPKTPLLDQVVSLVNLIAAPEEFDGKMVHVTGFLTIQFEGDALYLARDHSTYGLTKNAVWINVPSEIRASVQRYDESYVMLSGRFTAGHGGHGGIFSGELTIEKADDIGFTADQKMTPETQKDTKRIESI